MKDVEFVLNWQSLICSTNPSKCLIQSHHLSINLKENNIDIKNDCFNVSILCIVRADSIKSR